MRLMFEDPELDGQLQRSVAKEPYGMGNLGECLAIATQIGEEDPDSWYDAFFAFAEELREAADHAAARGHPVSARERYLRASEYYRNAFYYHRHALAAQPLQRAYQAHRASFQAAMPLLDHPLEAASVPADGVELSGYFAMPDASGRPRPTLIVPGGHDSTAEELYPVIVAGLAHDYNVFVFDGPGQGRLLYEQGVPMRPDWETLLPPVVDVISSRSDVDERRLALLGRSFGSLLAPRGAAAEPRCAALVVDPGQYDLGAAVRERLPALVAQGLEGEAAAAADYADALLDDPRWRRSLLPGMASHGADSVLDYLRQLQGYHLRDHAAAIRCPTLVCDNETDSVSTRQGARLYEQLRCPKNYIRFTAAEGAEGHCEGLNQPAFFARMFDWLDETLTVH